MLKNLSLGFGLFVFGYLVFVVHVEFTNYRSGDSRTDGYLPSLTAPGLERAFDPPGQEYFVPREALFIDLELVEFGLVGEISAGSCEV